MTPDGMQIRGLHAGAPVPLDVEQASIDHHVALGLIEPIPKAQAQAVRAALEADMEAESAVSAAATPEPPGAAGAAQGGEPAAGPPAAATTPSRSGRRST